MHSLKIKGMQLLILFLSLGLILTGCSDVTSAEQPLSETPSGQPPIYNENDTEDTKDGEADALSAVIGDDAFTTSYNYTEETGNTPKDVTKEATIVFDGNSAQISGADLAFSNGRLTIKQAGTYVLSGTLSNGQILIDADKKDTVCLVLNGVSIHNESGPAIYAPQSGRIELTLAEGTQNAVSDGAGYVKNGEDDPNAVIFVQDDLSITGAGTLTVTGSYKHGIRTQDVLTIAGAVINVNAAGDALRGRDGVAIQNGNFTLQAGGDGIQSNNAADDAKGYVVINGGSYIIQAQNDGIQAQSALTITGGDFQITTGGGSANAPVRTEDFRGGWGGNRGGWPGGGSGTADDDSISMKALKAGKQLVISGGNISIDAEDDALHSNDSLFVTSGNLSIRTGDDGLHADAALEISGGKIDIHACYEGIEGLSVTITGGEISVNARDDALNAAGGVDSASGMGGPMGRDQFAVNGDIFIRISGGTLNLGGAGDGIDSNGNIYLEGGTVKVSGPSMGMEGAIDFDGVFIVSGGELITAGSVQNVSQDSTQPVIFVSYTLQQNSGSVITIKDASGHTLLEYTSRIAYSLSGFTSPSFKIGETYSLFIDGEKKTDIKLESMLTGISDDGGVYNGGRGGGRGNWGGGGAPSGGGQRPPGGGNQPSGAI